MRLSHDGYTAAHHCLPPVLDKWSRVLGACESAIVSWVIAPVSGLSLLSMQMPIAGMLMTIPHGQVITS